MIPSGDWSVVLRRPDHPGDHQPAHHQPQLRHPGQSAVQQPVLLRRLRRCCHWQAGRLLRYHDPVNRAGPERRRMDVLGHNARWSHAASHGAAGLDRLCEEDSRMAARASGRGCRECSVTCKPQRKSSSTPSDRLNRLKQLWTANIVSLCSLVAEALPHTQCAPTARAAVCGSVNGSCDDWIGACPPTTPRTLPQRPIFTDTWVVKCFSRC